MQINNDFMISTFAKLKDNEVIFNPGNDIYHFLSNCNFIQNMEQPDEALADKSFGNGNTNVTNFGINKNIHIIPI